MKVRTLERYSNERIDRKMGEIVDTIENRSQSAIWTAIDNIITPGIELVVNWTNASSGPNPASDTAISERGEPIENTASIGNESERTNTFHELNTNGETREIFQLRLVKLWSQEDFFIGIYALITASAI